MHTARPVAQNQIVRRALHPVRDALAIAGDVGNLGQAAPKGVIRGSTRVSQLRDDIPRLAGEEDGFAIAWADVMAGANALLDKLERG